MPWIQLESVQALADAWNEPGVKLFFKHSTRCSISSMALNRFENGWLDTEIPIYFIDLIRFREVSNELASLARIQHESPQVILVNGQTIVTHASHGGIDPASIQNLIG